MMTDTQDWGGKLVNELQRQRGEASETWIIYHSVGERLLTFGTKRAVKNRHHQGTPRLGGRAPMKEGWQWGNGLCQQRERSWGESGQLIPGRKARAYFPHTKKRTSYKFRDGKSQGGGGPND